MADERVNDVIRRSGLLLACLVLALVCSMPGPMRVVWAQVYGPDVTTSGQAIGTGTGPGDAFDNADGTYWSSGTTSTNNVSWVGQDFGGTSRHIRRITIKHLVTGSAVSSADLQYSDDNSSYTTVQTVSITNDDLLQTFDISASGSHRYWRLLAKANPYGGGYYWAVSEIQMFEIETPTNTPTFTPSNTAVPGTATNTPIPGTPTDTPIPGTATITPTPTITFTPSNTPTPTPNLYGYVTLPPTIITATGTPGTPMPAQGRAGAIVYTVTVGESVIIAELFSVIALLIFGLFFMLRSSRK